MSVEYVDMVRLAREEHSRALYEGNMTEADRVVRHLADMYGLPSNAAQSMLDMFNGRQANV